MTTFSLQHWRNQGLVDKPWFSAVWFQSCWFMCVLGRNEWVIPILLALCLHFILVKERSRELLAMTPVALAGIAVDSALSLAGVFDFGGPVIPLWLALLWCVFAATLHRAFALFNKHWWLAVFVGGIGVPINYIAGANMGAVELPLPITHSAMILVVVWSVFMPMLYRIPPLTSRFFPRGS